MYKLDVTSASEKRRLGGQRPWDSTRLQIEVTI